MVSEVSSGQQFSRSSEAGVVADSQTRVFRVMMSEVGEYLDIQGACGVQIGDEHPSNTNIFCQSFSAAYEGDSRMVIVCTFQYGTKATSGGGGDSGGGGGGGPDIRPANWSTSTSLMEVPVYAWYQINFDGSPAWNDPGPAVNPVGDRYDGVTRLEPIVTINIEQPEPTDPTRHVLHVGAVNSNAFTLGSLQCPRASVMFRGVQSKPHVEAWGRGVFRGWMASYEFAFRLNRVPYIHYGGQRYKDQDIGWDMAVPLTGFNVRAFNPAAPAANEDAFGQPLKHSGGKIVTPLALFENVAAGDKVRAMVKVFEYENGGASQIPSAQPVPLNFDGTPRKVVRDNGEFAYPVLIERYRVAPEIDFTQVLGLRLT
jgi:hypothetical protein